MLRDLLREHSNDSLADRIILGAVPTALRATGAIIGGASKIAGRGLGLAGKFTSSAIGGFLGGGSKLASSLVDRTMKSVRGRSKKNPHYSSIGTSGRIIPVRKGDGNADIIAKMYSFLLKKYEYEKKNDEIKRNFELEQRQEDERRHKKLVDALKKISKKDSYEEPGTHGILRKLFDFVQNVIGKLFSNLLDKFGTLLEWSMKIAGWIPTVLSNLNGLKTALTALRAARMIGPTAIVGGAAVAGAVGTQYTRQLIEADRNVESLDKSKAGGQRAGGRREFAIADPGNEGLLSRNMTIDLTEQERSKLQNDYKKLSQLMKGMIRIPESSEDFQRKREELKQLQKSILETITGALKAKEQSGFGISRQERFLMNSDRFPDVVEDATPESILQNMGIPLGIRRMILDAIGRGDSGESPQFTLPDPNNIPQAPVTPINPRGQDLRPEYNREQDARGRTDRDLSMLLPPASTPDLATPVATSTDSNKERIISSGVNNINMKGSGKPSLLDAKSTKSRDDNLRQYAAANYSRH
jgi:hypothetical protein